MARIKYFGYLLNEQGQVIPAANISIYQAGSEIPAAIYTSESGTDIKQIPPQLVTDADGYYEFWIGDSNETQGYSSFQKFKIAWEKSGIVDGYNDYISILPLALPVDETNSNTTKDKSVSNNLARLWEEHRTDETYYLHGIEAVDVNSANTTLNKLVSNSQAQEWENTRWASWSYVNYSNVDAQSYRGYILDSSSNSINVFLPNSPNVGDIVAFTTVDVTNTIKIDRNTKNIFGVSQDLYLNTNRTAITLIYTGSTYGWSNVNETAKYKYETIKIGDVYDGVSPPAVKETITAGNGKIDVRKFSGTATEDIQFTIELDDDLVAVEGIQFKVISYATETPGPSAEGVVFAMDGYSIDDGESLDQPFGNETIISNTNLALFQYDKLDSGWSDDLDITPYEADTLQLRLNRPFDHADDTYANDIGIAYIKLRYRMSMIEQS